MLCRRVPFLAKRGGNTVPDYPVYLLTLLGTGYHLLFLNKYVTELNRSCSYISSCHCGSLTCKPIRVAQPLLLTSRYWKSQTTTVKDAALRTTTTTLLHNHHPPHHYPHYPPRPPLRPLPRSPAQAHPTHPPPRSLGDTHPRRCPAHARLHKQTRDVYRVDDQAEHRAWLACVPALSQAVLQAGGVCHGPARGAGCIAAKDGQGL